VEVVRSHKKATAQLTRLYEVGCNLFFGRYRSQRKRREELASDKVPKTNSAILRKVR
jgi:hypothetical protein